MTDCENLLPAPATRGETGASSTATGLADRTDSPRAVSPSSATADTSQTLSDPRDFGGPVEVPQYVDIPLPGGISSVAISHPPFNPGPRRPSSVLAYIPEDSTVHPGLWDEDEEEVADEEIEILDVRPVSTAPPAAVTPPRKRKKTDVARTVEELARKRKAIRLGKEVSEEPQIITIIPGSEMEGQEFYTQMRTRVHPDDQALACKILGQDLVETLGRLYLKVYPIFPSFASPFFPSLFFIA